MFTRFLLTGLLLTGASIGFQEARAACYGAVGCTERGPLDRKELSLLGCRPLAQIRGEIYRDQQKLGVFTPDGQAFLNVNAEEVRRMEQLKGCRY